MEDNSLLSKYAIIQTGGKQYQVVEGKTLAVELLSGNPGDAVQFDQVLLRKMGEGQVQVGQPQVEGAAVKASIIKHIKGKKIIVFRFKRRKKVRVKKGHRQLGTVVRIEAI